MPALQHSFRTLRREWRSGELRLIAAALIVAVAAVTAVTLFTDRVRQAMMLRANTLLAADLALDSSFPIAEPDRGGETFHIAPRLLMNGTDVPATGLIAPGSRVSYRLLLAGEPKAIAAYQSFVEARANEAVELVSVRDARPALRVTLERGEQYLRLTALASLFLAGIAIAMAARRFATRHLDHCAILRTLGATQGFILRVYALCLLWLGLLTSALGCVVGAGAQFVLARLLTGLVEGDLPAPSWIPLAIGTVTGLTALIGFALPPIAQLCHTPPARVLRRDLGTSHAPAHLI